jgi:hypothetical protein
MSHLNAQKVCFLPSLLSPIQQSFAVKESTGGRRGVGSGITVTATCTWWLGFKKKLYGLFVRGVSYLKTDYTVLVM